jgi:hypothetical protein
MRHLLQFSRETHIHGISNTYVPFSQLFAKGKSLKSEGIGMPGDKNTGLHGACRTNIKNKRTTFTEPSCHDTNKENTVLLLAII